MGSLGTRQISMCNDYFTVHWGKLDNIKCIHYRVDMAVGLVGMADCHACAVVREITDIISLIIL